MIYGFQKMTLLDFPGKVACTVFLRGCDFRCPYCHNYALACGDCEPVMTDDELFEFLNQRRGKLEGVAITGGEPCLSSDLLGLIQAIRSMGYAVKLDTNGMHPEMLERLISDGLVDYVAMDIKNRREKYAETAGVPWVNLKKIGRSIELLMGSGCEYEFRTTVCKEFHEVNDFVVIGEWIAGANRYYLQRFVDRESVRYGGIHAMDEDEMGRCLEVVRRYVPNAELRGV